MAAVQPATSITSDGSFTPKPAAERTSASARHAPRATRTHLIGAWRAALSALQGLKSREGQLAGGSVAEVEDHWHNNKRGNGRSTSEEARTRHSGKKVVVSRHGAATTQGHAPTNATTCGQDHTPIALDVSL
jgi:hypothetical protein